MPETVVHTQIAQNLTNSNEHQARPVIAHAVQFNLRSSSLSIELVYVYKILFMLFIHKEFLVFVVRSCPLRL